MLRRFRDTLTSETLALEVDRKRERQLLSAKLKTLTALLRDATKMCRNAGEPTYARSYLLRACELLVELEQVCLVSDLPREEWWGTFVSPAAAAVKRFADLIPRYGVRSKDGSTCWCGAIKIQRGKNRICPVHRPGARTGDGQFYACGHPRTSAKRCEPCRRLTRPSRAKLPSLDSERFKTADYLAREFDRKVALATGVPVCKFCAEFKTERTYQFQQRGKTYTRRAWVCYCRRPDLLERAHEARLARNFP